MKTLKRTFSFLIIILLTLFVNINIFANDVTEMGGARYYVQDEIARNELPRGVIQHTDISYSSAKVCNNKASGLGSTEDFIPDKYYPQQVNVLEIPSSKDIKITPWANINSAAWTLSTVKSMIKDYEKENPGYKVIAAINGDFFDINANKNFPRTPSGVHVSDGHFYKSSSTNTIGFKNDGSSDPLIGNVKFTRSSNMVLAVYDENNNIEKEFPIDKINAQPGDGEIAVYFANFSDKQVAVPIDVTDGFVVETANYALPHASNDFYGIGTISKKGNATLGAGQFAIVSKNTEVTNALAVGVKIRAQYEFSGEFSNIKDAIGVGETILYNGQYTGGDNNRHPRTMVGVKEDGTIIMTVVDGRQPTKNMYGATSPEMAAILKHYGAVEGYNLDGGGSSTMVIVQDGNLKVLNSPSDGHERSDSNCLIIAMKIPTIEVSTTNITTNQFTLNANVVNKNGYDFDKLYVGIGNNIKEVVNGSVTFDNLQRNTRYEYEFYQKVNNEYVPFELNGFVFTAKQTLEIKSAYFYYNKGDLVAMVSIDDPDGTLVSCIVYIGEEFSSAIGGKATFDDFDGDIQDIKLRVSYDLNDGNGKQIVDMTDFPLQLKLNIFMKIVSNKIDTTVTSVYN